MISNPIRGLWLVILFSIAPWMPQEVLESLNLSHELPKKPDPKAPQNQPGLCCHSMIQPFHEMTFKSFIWYQGGSNSKLPNQYKILFPALIRTWRERCHAENRPFCFVRIAPYMPLPWDATGEAWAWLRDSQTATHDLVPNTGMTVITDLGEYQPIQRDPQAFVVPADRLEGFTICGADPKFVPARAAVVGKRVEVWKALIAAPVAVRYGWANFPLCNLFSKDGLPAGPFRTDDFPMPRLEAAKME